MGYFFEIESSFYCYLFAFLKVSKVCEKYLLDIKSILFFKHDGHYLCKDMKASKPNSLNEGPLVP